MIKSWGGGASLDYVVAKALSDEVILKLRLE